MVYGGFFHAAFINFIIIYCVLCMTIAIAIWSFLLNILEKINLFQKGNSLFYIFIVYGFIWFGIIENTIAYPINIIKEFIK